MSTAFAHLYDVETKARRRPPAATDPARATGPDGPAPLSLVGWRNHNHQRRSSAAARLYTLLTAVVETMIFILALVCFIATGFVGGQIVVHELCKPTAEWTANGRDVMLESRGRILLVAFMELNSPYCHLQLNQFVPLFPTGCLFLDELLCRFKIMNDMLTDVRFAVIAPRNESDESLAKWQRDLNSADFIIFRETDREPVWRQLNARNHDIFIFDR